MKSGAIWMELHAQLKRAQEQGVLTRRAAVDAQRQVEGAVIAAEELQPNRDVIVRHLGQALDIIADVAATGGLVAAINKAIDMVQRLF